MSTIHALPQSEELIADDLFAALAARERATRPVILGDGPTNAQIEFFTNLVSQLGLDAEAGALWASTAKRREMSAAIDRMKTLKQRESELRLAAKTAAEAVEAQAMIDGSHDES